MTPRSLALLLSSFLAACASAPPPVASAPPPPARRAPALSTADQARELATAQRSVTNLRWDVQRRLTRMRDLDGRAEARCLDERLTELDATLRMLREQREGFLFEAGDDGARRDRAFRRAMALRSRATEVAEEARRCESGGGAVGATVVTVVVDEAIEGARVP